ncbi:hypothetical protein I6G55_26440 [Burkholderia oklahomensis]|nr:hypothetical protein [Burkholderia oklahomensis]
MSSFRHPHTERTSRRAWRARLDVAQISDVVTVRGDDTFERPIYGRHLIATVQSSDPVKVGTVRTTSFDSVITGNESAAISIIEASVGRNLFAVLSRTVKGAGRVALSSSDVIVSGGKGLGSRENQWCLIESMSRNRKINKRCQPEWGRRKVDSAFANLLNSGIIVN